MACEDERTRLIGQIASLLRESSIPKETRDAGLTLIGWLARRMPGEPVSIVGVEEMCRRCAQIHHEGTNGVHVDAGQAAPAAKRRRAR
jgi:hypothetical protein